jgi:rfaE bifunctional protein kinase chain/domain
MTTVTRSRIVQLLEGARNKHIAVIGDVMLDVYLTGDIDRISPEAPVPIVRVSRREEALGGAANVAQNIVALNGRCSLVAITGADRGAEAIRRLLTRQGISDSLVLPTDRRTTEKTRLVARSQQVVRFDEEDDGDVDGDIAGRVLATLDPVLADAEAVVIEDYNKGLLSPEIIRAVIDGARSRGIPVIVDPKYRHFFLYHGAHVFKPNRRELEAALGATVDLDKPDSLPPLLERLKVDNLLLTLGDRGMMLAPRTGGASTIPTVAREVFDVVGAGDTVTCYMAMMLAAGANPIEAAVIANIAAGIGVGKLGAATVSASELLEYVDTHALHS